MDFVIVGASWYLISNPQRLPFASTIKSSSARLWVAQK